MEAARAHPWSAGFESLEQQHDIEVGDIEGRVPAGLHGTLFRNGSGRNRLAGAWFPHWFDGDGMVQSIRFAGGGVHYRNRYVATDNYRDETAAQRILHRGFGKLRPGGFLANALRKPANVSNTSVVMEGGRLLSLWEGGPPYELDPASLQTRGVADHGGLLKAFSAHPKIDPDTGELFNFGIDYGPRTTLTLYRLKDGAATRLSVVTLPYPLMNHDFALTKNHFVFCLGPILLHSLKMILGLASFDGALHWDGGKPTLILLVPREGRSPPRWIEAAPFFQFHFANAYEADGALTIDLARYSDYLTIGPVLRDYWRSAWPAEGMATFTRLVVDLASGRVETRPFASGNAHEFPRIHPARAGKPYRYAYIACNPPERAEGLQQQIAKIDVGSGAVGLHAFGAGEYVGEPVFVPTGGAGEDDGVVVTLVFDATAGRSSIVGLDARDIAAKPLFIARLGHHVPYSLHGFFAQGLV